MRAFRLLIAVAIVIQAFLVTDIMFGIAGLILSALAIFNIGCCGTAGCDIPEQKTGSKKEITYEEVV